MDAPEFNDDGSMTVPKGQKWVCYDNMNQYCKVDELEAPSRNSFVVYEFAFVGSHDPIDPDDCTDPPARRCLLLQPTSGFDIIKENLYCFIVFTFPKKNLLQEHSTSNTLKILENKTTSRA